VVVFYVGRYAEDFTIYKNNNNEEDDESIKSKEHEAKSTLFLIIFMGRSLVKGKKTQQPYYFYNGRNVMELKYLTNKVKRGLL